MKALEISHFSIFPGVMDTPEFVEGLDRVLGLRQECLANMSAKLETMKAELDSIRPGAISKKPPAVSEPDRVPEHCFRDYLLGEIMWLQNDITLECKWKSTQARKFAKDSMKHRFVAEREAGVDITEQNLRKVSATLASEVEKFWKGVRQLAQHRFSKLEAELKREQNQKRLDELVGKTEEYVKVGRKRTRSDMDDMKGESELDNSTKTALLDKISKEMTEAAPTGNSFSTSKVSIPVPTLLHARLREYQHIGMEWLAALHERGLNGILADEMGLGKTLQTIALLAHLAEHKGNWGPHLIVVPTSVMINWEIEFKKFLPGFKVMVYFGSPKERRAKRVGWRKDELIFNVCICSYALVLQDALVFRKKNWQYLILDEAHQIKNFKSLRWQNLLTFKTERRLLLTGTPLQNDLIELWSLLHFLMPHIFTSHLDFQDWFSDPLNRAIEHSKLDQHSGLIQRLHCLLRPFLLRRLKKDVEKQMPSKYEHVLPVPLTRRQQVLYDEFLSHRETRQLLASRKSKAGGDYLGLMNVLMQLRKVCNHPDLVEPRPVRSPLVMALHDLDRSEKNFPIKFESLVECPVKKPFWFIELEGGVYEWKRSFELKSGTNFNFPENDFQISKDAKWYLENPYVAERWVEGKRLRMHGPPSQPAELPRPWIGLDGRLLVQQCIKPVEKLGLPKDLVMTVDERFDYILPTLSQFIAYTDPVIVSPWEFSSQRGTQNISPPFHHKLNVERKCRLPERRFLEWDCGKLRFLHNLLTRLRAEGHKVILFTQMSKMLDVIEAFANLGGFTYVRLDGSTKVVDRQLVVDRFNRDKKLFLFISSTRAGGVGINLTGADTVVFFDSDWNPAMDRQAMDRCHRIGQVRDVHVYRLISEKTIEENIFAKQLQKRQLDHVVIDQGRLAEGEVETDAPRFVKGGMVEELFETLDGGKQGRADIYGTHVLWERDEGEKSDGVGISDELLAKVEDAEDVIALKTAQREQGEQLEISVTDEDAQYLSLPAIVRRSVEFTEELMVIERRTGKDGDEEEWAELEQAGWSSEDSDT